MFTFLVTTCLLTATDPAALLARTDAAANRATDVVLELAITVESPGAERLGRTVRVWQRGQDQRLVKFVAPARLRGTGLLMPEAGQTFLYLPAYEKVRRVVGRDGAGSFMGTGFSIGDLARTRFSNDYTASLVSESPTGDVLKLTPKAPDGHDHAALVVTIRREDALVSKIEAVDSSGKAIRTLVASDFRTVGAYTVAHHVDVLEHATGRKTTAKLASVQFDTGLSPDFFTERELKRAP